MKGFTGCRKKALGVVLLLSIALFAVSASASSFQDDLDAIDLASQSVLKLAIFDENNEIVSTGSGFVAFNGHTLLTNYHVIDDAADILAVSDDDEDYYLITRVIASDSHSDIAILELDSYNDRPALKPLSLASGGNLRKGEPVVVIGCPQFITSEVTKGDISALYDEDGIPIIQFTAPISHGSSGSPLFNDRGEVIGIARSTVTDNQNTNKAIDIGVAISLYKSGAGADIISFPWGSFSTSSPVPSPTPDLGIQNPLEFTDSKVERSRGAPYINPGIRNSGNDISIDEITVIFYCTDDNNQYVKRFGHREEYYYVRTFKKMLKPNEAILPGFVWLYGYEDAKYVYAAIKGYHTSDGAAVNIPDEKLEYFYWTLN